MRLDKFDLNLLVAFDALLAAKSVSAAAKKIGLSQPAMSDSLKRLRLHFNDKLLMPAGREMCLTPKAQALIQPVRNILLELKIVLTEKALFNPATSTRTFSFVASEYAMEVLIFDVMRRVAALAPGIRFVWSATRENLDKIISHGEADFAILPHILVASDHPSCLLFEDDFVAVSWSKNRHLSGGMTENLYFKLGHVDVPYKDRQIKEREWFVKNAKSRRTEVSVSRHSDIAKAVVGTHRIGVVGRRLASIQAETLPIAIYSLPAAASLYKVALQWHSANASDLGLQWLIDVIRSSAELLAPGPAGLPANT